MSFSLFPCSFLCLSYKYFLPHPNISQPPCVCPSLVRTTTKCCCYHHHYVIIFLSQVFFLPWYFSSWASGEPQHSGFKSQLVALSLWCVMFLVWQFFVGNLLFVVLVLFPDVFVNFCSQFPWPQWLPIWQTISCSTFAEFTYLDFYILVFSQPPFVLHTYLMVLLHQSISRFCPPCFSYYVRPVLFLLLLLLLLSLLLESICGTLTFVIHFPMKRSGKQWNKCNEIGWTLSKPFSIRHIYMDGSLIFAQSAWK
jgi:hypothetical protein